MSIILVAHFFVENFSAIFNVHAVIVDNPVVVSTVGNELAVFVDIDLVVNGLKLVIMTCTYFNKKRPYFTAYL